MLRDLRDNDEIFGSITTVLGGDFLQTLPVVKMNLQSPIVHACLLSSMLWPAIKTNVLKLCYDKDLQTDFIYFTQCTDTGVIVTHALSFYRPLAPLLLLTHAQLAVVTQSCALLYITAHCDLLLQ